MNRNIIIVIILAVIICVFFILKCNDSTSPARIDNSKGEGVKLFIDFENGQTNNHIFIFNGNPSKKPTYFKSIRSKSLSPSFNVVNEGLQFFRIASSPIYPYIYMSNGDELNVQVGVSKIGFKGSHQKLNQFLLDYHNTFEQLALEHLPSKSQLSKLSSEKVLTNLDELEAAHSKMLEGKASFLPVKIKTQIKDDFKHIKKFLFMLFLDKKYTTKQYKTALKYVNEADFKNEELAMTNPTFAKASMMYFDLKSYGSANQVKRLDLHSYYQYLIAEGLSPQYAERLCIEKAIAKKGKLKDQALDMTNNPFLIDYIKMNIGE